MVTHLQLLVALEYAHAWCSLPSIVMWQSCPMHSRAPLTHNIWSTRDDANSFYCVWLNAKSFYACLVEGSRYGSSVDSHPQISSKPGCALWDRLGLSHISCLRLA